MQSRHPVSLELGGVPQAIAPLTTSLDIPGDSTPRSSDSVVAIRLAGLTALKFFSKWSRSVMNPMPNPANSAVAPLSVLEAQKVLAIFNCLDQAPELSAAQQSIIRSALRSVVAESDCVIFGVCADSIAIALAAVRAYGAGLGLEVPPEPDQRGGIGPTTPVYIKCNTNSQLFYAEPYEGDSRGVLVACQSQLADGFNAMYGHLPLSLFDGEAIAPAGSTDSAH